MGNFSDLPSDVMLDIFTRLPTESIGDCKSVSKSWRNILRRPSFNQMHSNLLLSSINSTFEGSGKFSFIFRMDDYSEQTVRKNLYFLEYDDEVYSHRVRKLILNPQFELFSIVGSCNDLVCLSVLPNHYTMEESTSASYVAFICNPITGESITLPELNRSWYYDLHYCMVSVFGHVASTSEYKVVRIYNFCKEPKIVHIEVYTLGSGEGWRNVGSINKDWGSVSGANAVFVDGFLYLNFIKWRIVAFDLANEIFVELDEYYNENVFWTGVLGGHYRGIQHSEDRKSSDVWLLKKKQDESFSWSKEFTLINTDPYTISLALASNGTVLCYSGAKLYLYDLKSSSSKMLGDFGEMIGHVVPHMNTLVSLKAFGEETWRLEGR